jgi:CBS domain-containing protein
MKFTCGEIMAPNPACCSASDSVRRAAELMRDVDAGPIPVLDQDSKLIGIVADRDLVLNVLARGLDAEDTKVSEAMTSDPVSCMENEAIEESLERMQTYQIRRLPVVDSSGHVVGIIAQADVATLIEVGK